MKVDTEYLRRLYESMGDESLLELNREELVEDAQKIYDAEVASRQLNVPRYVAKPSAKPVNPVVEPDEEFEIADDPEDPNNGDKPEWVEDGMEVFSGLDQGGGGPPQELVDARVALEADGVPCYVEFIVEPEQVVRQRKRWRLLVPGNLAFSATSVLDRDLFNIDFEENWKTHLELLSDEEVRSMTPEIAFCGLFDRVERVNRVYREEIARRGMKQS